MHQGIARIEVRGFKSFKDLAVDLRPLNVLIGANAAGKSNFLAMLRMMNAITDQRLQAFVAAQGGSPALLHQGPKRTPRLDLSVICAADLATNRYEVELVHVAPGKLIFAEEIVEYHSLQHSLQQGEPQRVRLGGGHEESRLPDRILTKEPGTGPPGSSSSVSIVGGLTTSTTRRIKRGSSSRRRCTTTGSCPPMPATWPRSSSCYVEPTRGTTSRSVTPCV